MNKFNFSKENHNSFRHHFVLHTMSERTKANHKEFNEIFKIEENRNAEGDLILNVEVKVNGVDVPFDSFIDMLDKQFKSIVEEQAKRLVTENLGDIFNNLHDTLSEVEKEIEQKAKKLFPGFRNDE